MSRARQLFIDALRTATPSVEMIAARLGLSTSALRRYRLGNRTPSPGVLRRFAQVLKAQARALEKFAHQLDEEAIHQEDQNAKT
jgi:transcriptional regulator with XRE-family HTH domain